jgi:hypothetical protein
MSLLLNEWMSHIGMSLIQQQLTNNSITQMNENENAAGDKSFNWNKQRKRFGELRAFNVD